MIGDFAKDNPRYQGMGSSQVRSGKVSTGYEELKRHIQDENKILFAPGYHADDDDIYNVDLSLLEEAVRVARAADAVLLFVGLPEISESEGFDRTHLGLPGQHVDLIDAVNPNVVVVFFFPMAGLCVCRGSIVPRQFWKATCSVRLVELQWWISLLAYSHLVSS